MVQKDQLALRLSALVLRLMLKLLQEPLLVLPEAPRDQE
jgi:hypothetical protein